MQLKCAVRSAQCAVLSTYYLLHAEDLIKRQHSRVRARLNRLANRGAVGNPIEENIRAAGGELTLRADTFDGRLEMQSQR